MIQLTPATFWQKMRKKRQASRGEPALPTMAHMQLAELHIHAHDAGNAAEHMHIEEII
jgi:hypothetical protein